MISDSLLDRFDKRELRSAFAHELAHIVRRSSTATLLVFLVRILMFYNPVSLLVFRRLIQDDEQICDDITVSITKDPEALASALAVFHSEVSAKDVLKISALKDAVAHSSHNLLLEE
jgi:beta-lactamase regulating signal transducer with metallopeptidase domain